MRKVAILGGGMAGLTTAWRLSEPECRDTLAVTVYQRGWRLGGKGASSRGVHDRIEEHGLHVWLGYYDNAFRLVRQVYAELDRPSTDPGCPVRGFADAFSPSGRVGVGEQVGEDWSHWLAAFQPNDREPGAGAPSTPSSSAVTFVRRGLRLLLDFSASLEPENRPTAVLSGSPYAPDRRTGTRIDARVLDRLVRRTGLVATVGATEVLRLAERAAGDPASAGLVLERLRQLRLQFDAAARHSPAVRRTGDLANLVLCCLQGTLRDGLMSPGGFAGIDHLDFRDWLAGHGASERTLRSPLIRGMYDLVFAYADGDPARPRFSAGLGLLLAGRLFFDYSGSIFWHMRAGMGDIVFAPLYQALVRRGVRFEFFHRLDELKLSADRSRVEAITLGRQAEPARPGAAYQPLVPVGGLPCFPAAPLVGQLRSPVADDLETHWSKRDTEQPVRLSQGVHFDDVVLATSLGMVPHVAQELLAHSPAWRQLVARVATVPTQSLQVWLRQSESQLGWPHVGATVTGYEPPFDTYASMSHLLGREGWTARDGVRGTAYFCGVLAKDVASDPRTADAVVRGHARDLLTGRASGFWPHSRAADGGFRWDLLHGAEGQQGERRLDAQYWRANVDPSDQYVQSLPGTGASRLQADESGYANLFLAGDWINCGLNAGCIEAAVMAGTQAANAIRGLPLTDGLAGEWYGLRG